MLRLFEFADMPTGRPSKRTFLMTEQLRLDQLCRNRGAIQSDERRRRPRASFMKRARN